ncbi:FliH/SctL family protein [Candidatus Kapabacteria bacterium]|nr:FliH/SctL family protein [Candidatus Kapabacteria bacterium]
MNKYNIKISGNRRRIRVFRDPHLIQEELEKYNTSKYLRSLLLKPDESAKKEELSEEDKERLEQEELERIEQEARRQRIEDLKAKENQKTKFYQEFIIANENTPVQIELNKVREDSVPLSIAKEQIQRAYEDGLEDGQISAMATYKTEIAKYQEWVRRFDSVADDLKHKQVQSVNKLEESIVELSVLIAEKILDKEIITDQNIVINQIRKAIESNKTESIFKIHINPEAYELLKEIKSELIDEYQLNEDIKIHSNPTVPIGSCILETSAGLIDARIKNQLNQLESILNDEAVKAIKSEEMQEELSAHYESSTPNKIEEKEPEITEVENEPSDNFDYDDIPDEYKEMFSEDIFGDEDLDVEGNTFQEEEMPEPEPKNEEDGYQPEFDYSNLDQDEDDSENQDEEEKDDEKGIDDIDRNFDNLFDE